MSYIVAHAIRADNPMTMGSLQAIRRLLKSLVFTELGRIRWANLSTGKSNVHPAQVDSLNVCGRNATQVVRNRLTTSLHDPI